MLQADEMKDYPNDERKDHGGNDYIPCRQPLPSRQRKPDESFNSPVQKANFWFDGMILTAHEGFLLA